MNKVFQKIYLFLTYLFLYLPIVVLIIFSFNEGKNRGHWDGFSLVWYQELFQDAEILQAVYNTLLIAGITTIVSTVIGVLAAIGISQYRNTLQSLVLGMNQIPILNPDIVIAVGLMVVYRTLNIDLGFMTLLLGHIAFTVPYVVLSILPKLRSMPQSLPESAMDLGATPIQTLFKVILPFIQPGIISGALMAFTLSIDDFVISFFTTGNGVETISTIVFSMARRGISPTINALSAIMFLVTLVLMVVMNLRTQRSES